MHTLRSLLIAAAFLMLGACAPTQAGDNCLQDTDCGVGFTCEHGVDELGEPERVGACSFVPCEGDDECPGDFVCVDQGDGTSLCQDS